MPSSTPTVTTVALDDEATWPLSALDLLYASIDQLRAYEAERGNLDQLCQRDIGIRWNPPRNRYEVHRNEVIRTIDGTLKDAALVGYHCTRLTGEESHLVNTEGLKLLDVALVTERVKRLVQQQAFPAPMADLLVQKNLASSTGRGRREGTIWFVFTHSLLQEHGVWPLLAHWGGEAVYFDHVKDPEIGPLLRGVGTATIVCAAVPVPWIKHFGRSFGERMLNCYLAHRGIATADGPDVEGYIEQPIPPELIQRVVTRSDPEFAQLTSWNEWSCEVT